MSLTVRQLNADSTFLLTFQPSFAPKDSKCGFPGTFNILIDPWLTGSSTVFHSSFAHSTHSQPSAIKSLRELKEKIDVIIISQDKPDHCSRETLCSLPKDYKGRILATPKAAKKIRDWDHFDNSYMVQDLPFYTAAKPETIMRVRIPPYSSGSADGEVTIANIGSKVDLTRLHNAIGITYCPPGTVLTTTDGNTIKLTDLPMTSRMKASSPPSPTSRRQRPSISSPNGIIKGVSNALPQLKRTASNPSMSKNPLDDEIERNRRPSTSGSRRPNISSLSARQPNFENVLSILYTPHSVDASLLRPYINNHLALLPNALPITTLFHALNTESNPKLLGGLVSAGAPGGVGIVKEVDVKYWIAAHDEVKENRGWATKFITSKRYEVEEVVKMLRAIDGISGTKGKRTIVEVLETGGRKIMK